MPRHPASDGSAARHGAEGPPSRRSPDDSPAPARTLALSAAAGFALFYGIWTLLVGQVDLQDALAGIVGAAAALATGWLVNRRGRAVPDVRASDVAYLVRSLGRLVTETWGVWRAAARIVLGRPVGSVTRTVPVDVPGDGWRAARRAGVLGALLSFTPGSIVIHLDGEADRAVVHELRPEP